MVVTYDIIKRLCECGYHAYITGGVVRDTLAGLPSDDEDIVTNATPDELQSIFQDCHVLTVGKSFGVTLVDGIEVATYRADRYAGLNARDCEVSFVETLNEDLARRDFTINAMAFCQFTGDVVDPFDGRVDLNNRLIRFVGKPEDRINEDPNRIIRACRFRAKLQGKFEKSTLEALKKHAHYIHDYVANERIRLEILKSMEIKRASLFFQSLFEIGALHYIFPSLAGCVGHDHGKHHREDVFTHCMICGDHISTKFPLLKLAGYLHDVGKPEAWTDDGRFIGHERVGAEIVRSELVRLRFSLDEIEKIEGLIRTHMSARAALHEISPKVAHKLLAEFALRHVDFRDFLRLRVADRVANLHRENIPFDTFRAMYKKFYYVLNTPKAPFTVKDLAVNGRDVMELLDVPPGPVVGKILRALFALVLERGPDFNERPLLLTFLRNVYRRNANE